MSDRELTDLAAAAVGILLKWPQDPSTYRLVEGIPPRRTDTWENWNPKDDDGDALRLAVDLHITVFTAGATLAGKPICSASSPDGKCSGHALRTADPRADVRRAILLCAAEIARRM